MSSNADRIRVVNDALAAKDFEAVGDLVHPEAVWEHNIGAGTPEEGVYHGRGEVLALFERILEPWEYMRPEPEEIRDVGEGRYLLHGRLRAKHVEADSEIVTPYEQEVEFRDGLLRKSRISAGGDPLNVTLVRRIQDAFNGRDMDSLVEDFDPEVELSEWPTAPGASSFHGIDGVRSAMEGWFEVWEWMHVELAELVDAGDRVLATVDQRAKGKESEVEVEIRSYNVYWFRDGKVIRIQLFTEREAALEAAGLTATKEETR